MHLIVGHIFIKSFLKIVYMGKIFYSDGYFVGINSIE